MRINGSTIRRQIKSLRVIAIFCICIFPLCITACAVNDESSSSPEAPPPATISGKASKGRIVGGTVTVYKLNDNGSVDRVLGTGTTDLNGEYSVDINRNLGTMKVEVVGGAYVDEATGSTKANGTLRAVKPNVSGNATINVTAYTEIAVQLASSLDTASVEAANASVSAIVGTDIIATTPADVTNASSATQAEKDYGLALAAISQMANDTSSTAPAVMSQIAADLSDDMLDSTGTVLSTAASSFIASASNQSGETIATTSIVNTIATYTTIPTVDDTTPPSVPLGLYVSHASANEVGLSWRAASDNVRVAAYNIYNKDGILVDTAPSVCYLDASVAAETDYCYTVAAVDWAGNESAKSVQVCARSSDFVAIAGKYEHTLALKADGTVWAWGPNMYGQLGDGTTIDRPLPVKVNGLSDITAIVAGGSHSVALKADGTVWAWGYNKQGQLGDSTTIDRPIPVLVNGLSGITAIATGSVHSLALKADGTVWTWGWNIFGQLGNGTLTNSSTPVQMSWPTGVTSISSAWYSSVAIMGYNTQYTCSVLWGWGLSSYGQLGNGSFNYMSLTPVWIANGVTSIKGGSEHYIALDSDGRVWSWGWNNMGQLGDGTTNDRLYPGLVNGLTSITTIESGSQHALALGADGTLWRWGMADMYNDLTPVQVGITNVSAIAPGAWQTVALKKDGTLWAWGRNEYGQIGDGTYLSRTTPVRVGLSGGVCGNARPVADAGSYQKVPVGTTVILDGSGSFDPEGAPLAYTWRVTSRMSGSTATLSSASVASPTFTPDVEGYYELRLEVRDGVYTIADTVIIKTTGYAY